MLLGLPVELIQLILLHSSTESLLHAAYSCHTLYEITSTSRDVLLFHLLEIPGVPIDFNPLVTKDLFRLFQSRALNQLYRARFYSNSITYTLNNSIIDTRKSSLLSPDASRLAIVVRDGDCVSLYKVNNGSLTFIKFVTLPIQEPGTVTVLKTAFTADNGFAALFKFTPERESASEGEPVLSFLRQARQTPVQSSFFLVSMPGNTLDVTYLCSFEDRMDCKPLALASYSERRFAISWQLDKPDDIQYDVSLYQTSALPDNVGSLRRMFFK